MERQQRIAVVPGSFDPITKGHMDIIRRAKPLFDKVIVLVVINAVKNPCFSLQERVELIRASVADIPGVEVDCYKGLLVDYVKQVGACAIVKGLRAVSDFEYEFQQALINKELYSGVETVFLTPVRSTSTSAPAWSNRLPRWGETSTPLCPSRCTTALCGVCGRMKSRKTSNNTWNRRKRR